MTNCRLEAAIVTRLLETHRVTRAFGDAVWDLEWYEPK